MRPTTAYFAGVGTVAVAIAAGLAGGLLFSSIVAPHQPKYATEPTKLELRMAERTIPLTATPAPAVAATQRPAAAPVVEAPPSQTAPQPQTELPAAAALPEREAATNTPAVSATSAVPEQQAAPEPSASSREAFAKARDADLKRAATEKRRAERHQRWVDKHRVRQPREQDLEAVEQAVRDDTESRQQAFASEPARLDMPRIRLFGDD